MREAKRSIRLLIWLVTGAIVLLTPACDDDPVESEQDLEGLSAVWDMTATVTSNTCIGSAQALERDRIIMIQCGSTVSVIVGGGIWGEGSVSGSNLDIMCTEEHVAGSGCCSSHYSVGTMHGSSSRLDGSLVTNVVLDAVTCGEGSTCRIETQAALELVEPYQSSCMNRSVFGSPVSSDYLLPWRTGRTYRVSNSYCMPTGGHRQQLAYDFAIPIGDQVVAARAGIVRELQETFPDGGGGSDPNFVIIEHEDGTSAYYAHLKRNSVSVEVGASVEAGQVIALAGHSGTSDMAHLHFGVYSDYPPAEGQDEAVNFRNAEGPLDCRGGLLQEAVYASK